MAKKKINQPLPIETTPAPRTKILKSGAIYNLDTGRIMGQAAPNPYAITKENTHEYRRMRREKTEKLLRESIIKAHNSSMPDYVKSSPGAFAASGAMLYEQIVLNSEAYPRDRIEAWDKLGKAAGVLADPRTSGDSDAPLQQAAEFTASLAELVKAIKATIPSNIHATNGEVIDDVQD